MYAATSRGTTALAWSINARGNRPALDEGKTAQNSYGVDEKPDARALAGNLIAWHVWCDRHGRDAEKRQIHNNLRSIALARAARYERPQFQYSDTAAWLTTWGKALDKDAVSELLKIQKVADVPKYANVLNQL